VVEGHGGVERDAECMSIQPLLDRFTGGAGHAEGFAPQTGIIGGGGIAAQATNVAAALQPADRVTFVVRDYGCLPEDHGLCGLRQFHEGRGGRRDVDELPTRPA
jgi:hypothetical protein